MPRLRWLVCSCLLLASCYEERRVPFGTIEAISYIPDPYTTLIIDGRHYNLRGIQSGFGVGDKVELRLDDLGRVLICAVSVSPACVCGVLNGDPRTFDNYLHLPKNDK